MTKTTNPWHQKKRVWKKPELNPIKGSLLLITLRAVQRRFPQNMKERFCKEDLNKTAKLTCANTTQNSAVLQTKPALTKFWLSK